MTTEPKIDIVEFGPSDEMAWMVHCPPTDECDYRVYFTRTDAELADEMFRDDCLTDEDDADRRTQGVFGLVEASEANARIRALRSQVADLTAQRDAMVRATEELFFAMDQWRSGGMRVEGVQLAEKELRTALALCQPSPGAQPSKGSP